MKDKLWFFGGYNPFHEQDLATMIRPIGTVPGTPGVGSTVPLTINRNLYNGKLTYNVAQSQSLVFSVNGDPSKNDGNLFTISGPPSTWQGTFDSGAADYRVGYDGVFGSSWLLKGQFARHHELETYGGAGATTPLSVDSTVNPNLRTGGFGAFENHDFKRDGYKRGSDAVSRRPHDQGRLRLHQGRFARPALFGRRRTDASPSASAPTARRSITSTATT